MHKGHWLGHISVDTIFLILVKVYLTVPHELIILSICLEMHSN